MGVLYNKTNFKDRRRDLRKFQTDCESIVWNVLRNKQCKGLKFYRQFSIGPYILDFYCPKIRLAIEIDGGQHNMEEGKDYDKIRTQYLKYLNIKVIRFWNNEILENIDGVYDSILENC